MRPLDLPTRGSVLFGPFSLCVGARLLQKKGVPVALGGRALELLIALIENAGAVVSKRELMARVWDGLTVDEGSLRFQVATLRKALGDGVDGARYISNVPGRGYCFVSPLTSDDTVKDVCGTEPARLRRQQKVLPPVSMIGRNEVVTHVIENLITHRLVTIHGAGGIGKTTVARSAAATLTSHFDSNVVFLDLTAIKDSRLVGGALASALGLHVDSSDPTAAILAILKDMRALIVLDSCEHVIEQVAALGEALHQGSPGVAILATSREPLRAMGERVMHLTPLDLPPLDNSISASGLLEFAAARLFVERAAAAGMATDLSASDVGMIAEMCRALDGMPLAIEIAASRVGQHGLAETAQLLDGRFRLRWRGRRSSMPRHQTLYEALDWSFELLSERERFALKWLSVFPGFFTLEAGRAIMGESCGLADDIGEVLDGIVAKSMISVDLCDTVARYRLLDTTRAFAQAKLAESGRHREVIARHACYVADRLGKFDMNALALEGETREANDLLGDVRAALPWAFSDEGDRNTALRIAVHCGHFLIPFSLFDEAGRWIDHAMSILNKDERANSIGMYLEAAYGAIQIMTQANGDIARAAIKRGLAIAQRLRNYKVEYRLTYCLQLLDINAGQFDQLMPLARRLKALSEKIDEPHCTTSTLHMIATAHALAGDQRLAQEMFEQVIRERIASSPVSPSDYAFVGDPWIGMAITLWLRGFSDQAVRAARLISTNFPSVLFSCMGLASAAVIFREIGDPGSANFVADKLRDKADRYSMIPFQAVALGFTGQKLQERGCDVEAIDRLHMALGQLRAREYGMYGAIFARSLVKAFIRTGQARKAQQIVDARIMWIHSIGSSYDLPEWLRIRAEIELRVGEPTRAESTLRSAIDLAREQGALSWELRAETDLARLMLDRGQGEEAGRRLKAVLAQFEEGFATHDLIVASNLLEELGH